jgi:hypothetical protein
VDFKAFGVKLRIYDASQLGIKTVSSTDASSVAITYQKCPEMYPGVDYDKIALFGFNGGTLTVPAILKISVDIELSDAFYISESDFSSLTKYPAGRAYMPIKFEVGAVKDNVKTTWTGQTRTSAFLYGEPDSTLTDEEEKKASAISNLEVELECEIAELIKNKISGQRGSDDNYVTKEFSANNQIILYGTEYKGIGFGFEWLYELDGYTSDKIAEINMIETFIAEKLADIENPMSVKFTVSLEQTGI